MGFSGVDTMSFDIREPFKTTSLHLKGVEIELASWISQKIVNAVVVIRTGDMHLQKNLNKEQAEQLIENLQQHIANIKANEIEVLALETKAAA
jgi:hypothetical protein